MSGINEDVTREVEQFLYREARLLDERRFHEWLEFLTDDVRYWMAARTNRYPKSSKAIAILDPARYVEDDMTAGELVQGGHDAALVRRVVTLVDRAEYKRRQAPPGVRVTPKAFGKDRRLPITNRYTG